MWRRTASLPAWICGGVRVQPAPQAQRDQTGPSTGSALRERGFKLPRRRDAEPNQCGQYHVNVPPLRFVGRQGFRRALTNLINPGAEATTNPMFHPKDRVIGIAADPGFAAG